MKVSQIFPPTLRQSPGDAVAISHQKLLQAGFITQVSAGVYVINFLGLRVLEKIRRIVREEMNQSGGLEIAMPVLQPRELWEQTGRWKLYESKGIMFTTEVGGSVFGLSPTAEEVVTWLAEKYITSYKQLPLTLYQIMTKFRKEERPRFGLVRGREFEMKDAYSFDIDEAGMRKSFEAQRGAYRRAFERMGFDPLLVVQADSGTIGGEGSAEFMAVADSGEDTLLVCSQCNYGANREKATCRLAPNPPAPLQALHKEMTPHATSVDDLRQLFPRIFAQQIAKTIIYLTADQPIAVVIRGDRDVNEVKLANMVGARTVTRADSETIVEVSGAPVGFAGPIGLRQPLPLYFDVSVQGLCNFLCGANAADMHLLDVNFGRDLPEPREYYDLHSACSGDRCAVCEEGRLGEVKGIELGHIFMLQQGYGEKMKFKVQGPKGELVTPWMGCYGLGTTRCLQAIIEQPAWRDAAGMIWPRTIAPFEAVVIPTDFTQEAVSRVASEVYAHLMSEQIEVVLDDREDRFGKKIKDADLIGYPTKIIVGQRAKEGRVEVMDRKTNEKLVLPAHDVLECVREWRKQSGLH